MSKNIQLPTSVLIDLYKLIFALENYELDNNVQEIIKRLEKTLNAKLEAMEKRKTYTEYKTSSSNEEKENARQKYLDLAGINTNWRWGEEAEKQR